LNLLLGVLVFNDRRSSLFSLDKVGIILIAHILRRLTASLTEDEKFLDTIEGIERIVSKILSLGMIVVILIAIAQLSYSLGQKILITLNQPNNESFNTTLFELFGLFLNVLIALEILENITAYLRKHVIQVELVIVTSLIAVSRKIIILDLEKKGSDDLIALAVAVFSLSVSYLIIHYLAKKRVADLSSDFDIRDSQPNQQFPIRRGD
jgi:uncharacterized membrane protein (DUF373 family)